MDVFHEYQYASHKIKHDKFIEIYHLLYENSFRCIKYNIKLSFNILLQHLLIIFISKSGNGINEWDYSKKVILSRNKCN